MNPIFSAALEVQTFCRGNDWHFCFIGAVAVHRWGEPRLTLDVDLTLLTGFGSEDVYIDALLEHFVGRRDDTRDFALTYRVLLLRSEGGIPIDISLGGVPFEERIVTRASEFAVEEDTMLLTCSAEDLIVLKAFANREKDWLDIQGIVARQGGGLDASLIWRELTPLVELKEEPDILERLRESLAKNG